MSDKAKYQRREVWRKRHYPENSSYARRHMVSAFRRAKDVRERAQATQRLAKLAERGRLAA